MRNDLELRKRTSGSRGGAAFGKCAVQRKERPFSRAEFEARESVEFAGLELSVARPEDVIVAKLEWSRLGGSDQQLRNIAGILKVQDDNLDRSRIERWVEELGLTEDWRRAQQTQG